MKLNVEKSSPEADIEPVVCAVVRGGDFDGTQHQHPECEITWLISGEMTLQVGTEISLLQSGDLVFLGPNVPHEFCKQPAPNAPTLPAEAIVVQFLPQLPGLDDWLHRSSMRPTRQLLERASRGLTVMGTTRLTATRIIKEMPHSRGMKRVILLLQLLDLLATSDEMQIISPSLTTQQPSSASDRISKTFEHLEAHLAEPYYVPELAAMVGLGRSAFSRLFKKCTGRTVPQFVNEIRITRACRLLAETDLTVSQIAFECGFLSPAHFQRQFQERRQCTPLAYRVQERVTTKSAQ
jgi:AraC-like DNA-binding protein